MVGATAPSVMIADFTFPITVEEVVSMGVISSRTVLFREETRWPGYYFRADKPTIDEEKWHVFANCRFDPKNNSWETMTRPILHVFSSQPKEPALARV